MRNSRRASLSLAAIAATYLTPTIGSARDAAAPPFPPPTLRTFAGDCQGSVKGQDTQSLDLLATVGAQVLGAGIDALSGVLEAAGRDQVATYDAVLPLERRVKCISVAYVTTMDLAASGLPDLTKQPFALELYLRRSQDGSALAVMPTLLAYHQALQDGDTGSKARDLYVTLTFATPGSDKSSTASLSLGSRRPSGDVVSFEAVSAPARSGGAYATGEAATVWIANPFAGPPAPPPKADAAKPADAAAAAAAAKAKPKGAKPTSTEMDGTPRLIRIADPQPGGGFGKNVAPPANPATPATVAADAPGGPSLDVAPISVTITVRETRPGSPIAAILAVALKGSKPALVAAVDPTSIAAAQAAKATANQVATTAYVNALGDYYTKRSAYCATPMDAPAGVDVMKAQMNLVFAAKPLAATVPFTGQIVPQSGDKSICP